VTYDDATAEVTGPGSRFELIDAEIGGQTLRVFAHLPSTLAAVIDLARGRADDLFLIYEDEEWTFGDVIDMADALASGLAGIGVDRGDRVVIASRNYPDWIVAFFATLSIGAVAVPVNAWWTAEELSYGIADCGATVVVADVERAQRMASDPAFGSSGVGGVLVRSGGRSVPGFTAIEDLLTVGGAPPAVEVLPDADATILYTSGTTGHPKGAVSTHRAVTSALWGFSCRAAIDRLRRDTDDGDDSDGGAPPIPPCFILTVPLFHATGLIPVMLGSAAAGLKLVMMHKWDPRRALELIEREQVTNFVGVPTMAWDLLECPDFDRFDTSSLLAIGGGGAAAPPRLVKRVAAGFPGGRPTIGYGMTETNAYGPQNNGDDYLQRPTSCGRSTPILDVAILDEGGDHLPAGEVGEIGFRGPNVIRGYWNDPEATEAAIVDGWLRSGDIGHIDADGFVYVEDRAKDIVIRGGENIGCTEVESALYEHPAVHEAVVFGVPHERLGEEVAAAVFPRAGHTIAADDVRSVLREHLAPFKVPSIIVVRDEPLPRNASGKIMRRTVRDEVVATRSAR